MALILVRRSLQQMYTTGNRHSEGLLLLGTTYHLQSKTILLLGKLAEHLSCRHPQILALVSADPLSRSDSGRKPCAANLRLAQADVLPDRLPYSDAV